MKRIFISGALNGFNGKDFINNVHRMLKFAGRVRDLGATVYVPCSDLLISFSCGGLKHEEYYAHDLSWLEVCDAVALVPGWEGSRGVEGEINRANELNLPVLETLEDVLLFVGGIYDR